MNASETPTLPSRASLADRLNPSARGRWVALQLFAFVAMLFLFVPLLLAFSLAAAVEYLRYGQTARVKRGLAWVLNLRMAGLLGGLLLPLLLLYPPIAFIEKARYGQLTQRQKGFAAVVLAGGIALMPFVMEEYRFLQFAQVFVFLLVALALNVLTGYAGLISIGHGAFVLMGAMGTGVLLSGQLPWGENWPPLVAAAAAAVVTSVAGFVVGLPSGRLKGPYLALVTLALAISVPILFKSTYLEGYVGGAAGLVVPQPIAPEGAPEWLTDARWQYALVVGAAVLTAACVTMVLLGPIGRAWKALRDSEVGAQMVGVNPIGYRLLAFWLSALLAGFAGGLWVLLLGFVSADSFGVLDSVNFVTAVVVGGLGSVFGCVMAGVFLTYQPELNTVLAEALPRGDELRWALYGGVVILVVQFAPRGLAGALYRKQG